MTSTDRVADPLGPLLPEQTSDGTDTGWGDRDERDDDVARLLAEKPPHHVD